ncbi:translation factor GUF1 like, mitochondrial [Saprolegnia diclina VS20]|uniref:Translation factor GUF1 homolog, mitochondrial n=1 Tax=Saprolegnia diclina (strain VS20) TaxID=1156394 RepID=T0RSL8_SAPDV|nr:translation factor GUF1 like, mitochondrial [Saprolegnia diclina VS20]EQC33182.1 translation factor GUF1 like, mitochondrial [Saprolegnia diclina VS20]|eukprot:XP_008613305.1 translation factor GUF1 like, mitochondrial [Saprolegnia diclina VS20]
MMLRTARRALHARRFSSTAADDVTPKTLGKIFASQMHELEVENTRNFSIVAHIDHGKSTLADRLLELSGNITTKERESAQHLDNLKVERERGITVKAQTASMLYRCKKTGKQYLLNLVDTPGHVDFSYEVSRSLSACEGVLLLVDASQGIQAQTLATYHAAKDLGLRVVPILTKIDMPHAQPEEGMLSLSALLDVDPESVLLTSAKSGVGIDEVLPAVIEYLPPPIANRSAPLKCLLVDSYYDDYRGIVCLVKVVDGCLAPGEKVTSAATKTSYDVQEVGVLLPHRFPTKGLYAGQVGYIIAGMKTTTEARVGDTFHHPGKPVEALPGFQEAKSMVFASMYPTDECTFDDLRTAMGKLTLNDASVTSQVENSGALGMGYRCGFLGLLHMEVFHQRLSDEQNMQVLVTAPMVPYTVIDADGERTKVETPGEFPESTKYYRVEEPMVEASIITPAEYVGAILISTNERRGEQTNMVYLDDSRVALTFRLPWQEVVTDFYNELKTVTSGYASLNYREIEPQEADIVKVDVLINGKILDALSFVCHRSKATAAGRALCLKLKNVIDRQQYEINIQATLGAKIFAKERIPPFRKDVLIKSGKQVGGGDITRKQKLLKKQKEGKKRMKTVGNVQLSQNAFWSVLSK